MLTVNELVSNYHNLPMERRRKRKTAKEGCKNIYDLERLKLLLNGA